MKTTTVTCDTCGRTLSGHGWATLWARAAKLGWIKGRNAQKHYCCTACMVIEDMVKFEFPKEPAS